MRLSAPVKVAAQRLALPTLIFAAAMLTVLGKADVLLIDRAREAVADAAAPVLTLIAAPVASAAAVVAQIEDSVAVYRQNEVLREDNLRLLQWQEVARRLAAENATLRDLDKLVPDQAMTALAARVIADSGGAFMRNVLVDAGARDGVARGQAAMTGEGLVGRVAEVGERTARILLLTDLNSHIPVMVERTSERAMLDGDNSDRPRLAFLDPKAEIVAGRPHRHQRQRRRVPAGPAGGRRRRRSTAGIVRVEPYAELSRLEIVRSSITACRRPAAERGAAAAPRRKAAPPPRRRMADDAAMTARRCRGGASMAPGDGAARAAASPAASCRSCRRCVFVVRLGRAAAAPGLRRGDAELRAHGGLSLDHLPPRPAAAVRRCSCWGCCSIC